MDDKKMNLKGLLKRLDSITKIKMGSVNGSSYFYIGTVGDLQTNMRGYDEQNFAYYEGKLKSSQNIFHKVVNTDVSYQKYIDGQYNGWKQSGKKILFGIDGYELFLKRHSETAQKKFDSMVEKKEDLKNRVSLENRKVIDYFRADKTVEPDNVIIIMVDGNEVGSFWTTNESKEPKMSYVAMGDISGEE